MTGDVTRSPDKDHFAAYNGSAPIEVPSGPKKLCRLSRRGNRQLDHGLHLAAITQVRCRHSEGRAYYDRKVAEGRQGQDPQGGPAGVETPHQRRALRRHGGRRPARTPTRERGGRPGRAKGERLCSLRGRLTPRNTGSSAKPLPGQLQGYAPPARGGARRHPWEAEKVCRAS